MFIQHLFNSPATVLAFLGIVLPTWYIHCPWVLLSCSLDGRNIPEISNKRPWLGLCPWRDPRSEEPSPGSGGVGIVTASTSIVTNNIYIISAINISIYSSVYHLPRAAPPVESTRDLPLRAKIPKGVSTVR